MTKKTYLYYEQDPTITVSSTKTITVQAEKNFTYEIQATSELGSSLKYENFKSNYKPIHEIRYSWKCYIINGCVLSVLSLHTVNPPSLEENISLGGTTVSGQITEAGLLSIIELGMMPTFSVSQITCNIIIIIIVTLYSICAPILYLVINAISAIMEKAKIKKEFESYNIIFLCCNSPVCCV